MKFLYRISSIVMLLAFSSSYAAEETPKASFAKTEVAPGIFMLMGVDGFTGGNLGLSIGDDGVVLIDDSMPPYLDIMNRAIQSATDKPIDFLINTHVHGDHMGNNETLAKQGVRIVAHQNLREHLLIKGVSGQSGMQPAPKAALPVITFSHDMNFYLNGNDAHIFHVANAHTDGDAVIHFNNANVIHTGDTLFNGMFPYIDLASGGSVNGYIKAQQRILSLADDQTKIIPGHGALASKQDLQASLAMLQDATKLVTELVNQGKTEEQVVKINPLAKYHDKWNWQFITTERMTRQLFLGIQKTAKSARLEGHSPAKPHTHSH